MLSFLTLLLASLCFAPLLFGYWRARPENVVLWVLGLFSFGYFVLPLIFRELSPLAFINDDVLITVVFMALLFLAALMIGVAVSGRLIKPRRKSQLLGSAWDRFLFLSPRRTFYVSLTVYLAYLTNATLSVYQSGGVENFIENYRPIDAVIAFAGNIALALMAIVFARGLRTRTRVENLVLLGLYLSPVLLLLATAQRNAVLIPFIYLASAIALFGHARLAFNATIGGVATIVMLSPLLVFFRETSVGDHGLKFSDAASRFSFEGEAFSTIIASLVNRADVLYNMALIMQNFDYVGFAGDQYFYSIIVKFVPGLFFASKPIALSSTGTIDGHLSVIAWHLIVDQNSTGSLTIFGAITAFREGGWIWMATNGFLTGFMFTFLFRHLGEREEWKRMFYIVIFPGLCVQSVPPSFFELLTSLSAIFYVYLSMEVVQQLLTLKHRARLRQDRISASRAHMPGAQRRYD